MSGLYFSVVTMTTVGYGDIHPTGWASRLCLVALMPFTTAALAYALNDATKISTRAAIRDANFKMRIREILHREAAGDPDVCASHRAHQTCGMWQVAGGRWQVAGGRRQVAGGRWQVAVAGGMCICICM